MQQRHIIIFIVILFIASSFWLFWQNDRQTDPNLDKNWWSVSFAEPKSDDLGFIIDNHSNQSDFQWKILVNGNEAQHSEVKLKKGESENIKPADIKITTGQNVTIQVSSGDEKKEIYKNF